MVSRKEKLARRARNRQIQAAQQVQNFSPTTGALRQQLRSVSFLQYSGPIPPPEVLKAIEEACPGGASRIIGQMEEQGRHRRSREDKVLDGNQKNERLGQIFGFIICLVVVFGGIFLLYNGINLAGYLTLIGGLGVPATLFIYSKVEGKKELAAKKENVQRPPRPNLPA